MSKAVGGFLKKVNKVTNKIDANVSKEFLPDGQKFGHIFHPESEEKHKNIMHTVKGINSSQNDLANDPSLQDAFAFLSQPQPNEVSVTNASSTNLNASNSPVASNTPPLETTDSQVVSLRSTEITTSRNDDELAADISAPNEAEVANSNPITPGNVKIVEGDTKSQSKSEKSKLQVKSELWAKTLVDHKEVTNADKKLLPNFFKTQEEVDSLINETGTQCNDTGDATYIQVATDLTMEILGLYPDLS